MLSLVKRLIIVGPVLVVSTNLRGSAPNCSYSSAYPRQYVAYKTSGLSPESLDGDLSKQPWTEVEWTTDFVDISTHVTPQFRTRAKVRWDDEFLYVAAELEEPHIWATLTEHDSVIFNDNDFEIFVDPSGTTHFYKEFEMNAFNTTWMLCLNKPYSDGGFENSTRVPQPGAASWTMEPPLRSAVAVHPREALNNPNVTGHKWTVEVALPLAKLAEGTGAVVPPALGSFWRLDFSRVEYAVDVDMSTGRYIKKLSCQSCPVPGAAHEDNWVWSPQGEIAMHLPERWGLLQFEGPKVEAVEASYYSEWPSRGAAMAIYYAEKAYASEHGGNYTDKLEDLLEYSSEFFPICREAETSIVVATNQDNSGNSLFEASVTSPAGSDFTATVRQDRYLTVTAKQ